MQLAGKAALISGAGGGICRAIALAYAEAGASVCCVDIDPEAAAETARLVTEIGGRSMSRGCDVSDEAQTLAASSMTQDAFGRLDILVSGAAPHDPSGTILETSLGDWRRVLDVNLTGSFRVVRAAVPALRERGQGTIVLISSINGLRGKFGQSNYAASKAGVVALAKSVAHEAGAFGIRVNAIAPGLVRTTMTADLPSPMLEEALRETPLQRVAEPEDVADVILFLCSPLSRHMTGTVLRVDGGQCTGA